MVVVLGIAALLVSSAVALAVVGEPLAAAWAFGVGVLILLNISRVVPRSRSSRRRRSRLPFTRTDRRTESSRVITLSCTAAGTPTGGAVCTGPWAGRRLETLSLDTILEIGAGIDDDDVASLTLLARYLDTRHPDWRARSDADDGVDVSGRFGATADRGQTGRRLDRGEALRILGLSEEASPEDIRSRHRHLILRVHPDVGGSAALTNEVNAAKTRLLEDWARPDGRNLKTAAGSKS